MGLQYLNERSLLQEYLSKDCLSVFTSKIQNYYIYFKRREILPSCQSFETVSELIGVDR